MLREVGCAFLRVVQFVGDFLLRAGGGYFGWVEGVGGVDGGQGEVVRRCHCVEGRVDVDCGFGGNVRSVWFFDLLQVGMVVVVVILLVVLGCGGCLRAAGTPLPGGAWAARGVGDEGGV